MVVGARWSVVTICACALVLIGACAPMEQQSAAGYTGQELLVPWRSIRSAWRTVEDPSAAGTVIGAADRERIQLQYPVGVAARGNDVYIADAGLHQILRYDRARETLSVFAPLRGISANQTVGLFVARDQSLLIANPAESRVVLLDRTGRARQVFVDDFNLARPFAVIALDARGEVWVADGLHNHIVVFSSLGRSLRVIDLGTRALLRRVGAMGMGAKGIYLSDRGARKLVLISAEDAEQIEPRDLPFDTGAIALDADNRLFVAGVTDDTISVLVDGVAVARVGGSGAGPLQFNQITALAFDENLLYVADSLNARVQVFLVGPAEPQSTP